MTVLTKLLKTTCASRRPFIQIISIQYEYKPYIVGAGEGNRTPLLIIQLLLLWFRHLYLSDARLRHRKMLSLIFKFTLLSRRVRAAFS